MSILFTIIVFIIHAGAQNNIPLRSDITYEVSADSLQRNNSPQDLTISISSGTIDDVDKFILSLSDTQVLWTVVSAEMNGQPLWLIMNETKAERADILAWQYDSNENELKLFPPSVGMNYELDLVLQVNLLNSNKLHKASGKEVVLVTESDGNAASCSLKGNGNRVGFR